MISFNLAIVNQCKEIIIEPAAARWVSPAGSCRNRTVSSASSLEAATCWRFSISLVGMKPWVSCGTLSRLYRAKSEDTLKNNYFLIPHQLPADVVSCSCISHGRGNATMSVPTRLPRRMVGLLPRGPLWYKCQQTARAPSTRLPRHRPVLQPRLSSS